MAGQGKRGEMGGVYEHWKEKIGYQRLFVMDLVGGRRNGSRFYDVRAVVTHFQ